MDKKIYDIDTRLNILRELKAILKLQEGDVSEALRKDLAKSSMESYISEISIVYEEIDYFLKNLRKLSKDKRVGTRLVHQPARSFIKYKPYGLVGIISPWNYPYQLALVPLIGAIAAGNSVVLRTSSKSAATSKVIQLIIEELNSEYIRCFSPTRNRDEFFDLDLDFLFFTGSSKVGNLMYKEAADKMIPCVLELGGKSPVIVTKSSDLSLAAKKIIWGKTMNAGQTCIAPDYLLVDSSIKNQLFKELEGAIKEFYGPDILNNPDYPKIINLDAYRRLEDLAKGEGIFNPDDYNEDMLKIAPRIFFTDMNSPFMENEIFGPFLPIIEYEDFEEVEKIINVHPDPLALYIFSQDEEEIASVLQNIDFGGACINDVMMHFANHSLPFGGIRNSGLGKYHSKYSFEVFSQKTGVYKSIFNIDMSLRFPPYKEWLKKFL